MLMHVLSLLDSNYFQLQWYLIIKITLRPRVTQRDLSFLTLRLEDASEYIQQPNQQINDMMMTTTLSIKTFPSTHNPHYHLIFMMQRMTQFDLKFLLATFGNPSSANVLYP